MHIFLVNKIFHMKVTKTESAGFTFLDVGLEKEASIAEGMDDLDLGVRMFF